MTLLVIKSVSRTYEGAVPVTALRPTTISVHEGEFVSIAGTSGSGKSTFMNLLGLLDRPSSGSYSVAGVETTVLGEKERTWLRARCFGFVFQAFHLLADRTAAENVELGMLYRGVSRRERRSRAASVLAQVGMSHRSHAYPPTLSGGERQRTAIARALVGSPPVLLCDEPTGNLDQRNAGMVLDLLEDLNRFGQTIVVVTHDPVVADRARRHLHVSDGNVSE